MYCGRRRTNDARRRTTRAGVSAVADIPIRKKIFPQRTFNDFSENNVK